MQLVTIGEAKRLPIAPPSGAEFSWNIQLIILDEEYVISIPPPPEWATLPDNVQFVTVGEA
jgi:hypothetical protein